MGEEIRLQAKSRKEILSILNKHRVGKTLYISCSIMVMKDDESGYRDYANIPVTYKAVKVMLNDRVGLFSLLDRDNCQNEDCYVDVSVYENCIFIG